jgi:predicted negative regulator of RcsB-dependent stress response
MEKRINNIVGYLFVAVALITPLIFSPVSFISFPFAKLIPFFLVVFFALFLWIVQSFNEGKFVIPGHPLFFAVLGVPLAYLISGLFSVNRAESFLGLGVEVGTVSFIAGLFLFMWLVSQFVRTKNKIFVSYIAIGISFLILAVFHTLRLFFGVDFLSFGIFTNIVSNTLGRWTDLAIFSGVAVILALTTIEFLRLDKVTKALSYAVLVLGLFLLAVTNFPVIVWGQTPNASLGVFTLIGLFSLVFFVYFISASYDNARKMKTEDDDGEPMMNGRKIPPASLIVLVVSIIFTLGAGPLQSVITSYFKVEPVIETRLLWQPTASLSLSTITDLWYRPLVGYGPEQFSYKWLLDKPVGVNDSLVWNSTFESGIGFIPSTLVTTGLLGLLSWLAFLGLFGFLGFKAVFAKFKDSFSQYLAVSSFLVSLFLWITQIFYTPSIFSFIMTFFFTGIFLGSLFREKIIKETDFVFENSKEKSFVSIMGLIILLIAVLFWAYKIGETVAASIYANRADVTLQTAQSVEDVERSKVLLENAVAFNPSDAYLRALANISLAQVNGILQDESTPVDELRTKFQTSFGQALTYARGAVAVNPNGYDNYITLGNVLQSVVALNVPDAYENAQLAYEEAKKLNPNSPVVPYLLARLEIDRNNIDSAKAKIGEALQLKPYYFDAIILLGRIQIGEGKNADALTTFSLAQQLDPQNQDIRAVIQSLQGGSTLNLPETIEQESDVASSTDEE